MDFCSARVAEALLSLSPDEMYLLAQEALEEAPTMAGELTYDAIVRLATERISRGLSLPTFDEWAEVYRKDPERYDREMLGLWRTDLEGADEDGS